MSETNTVQRKRFPLSEALDVARFIQAALENFCERIQIVGSIRRQKPDVGDIELLYIPKLVRAPDPNDMFGTIDLDLANQRIDYLLADGTLSKRPNINGVFAWGQQNKLAIHNASGIPVDLFATTPEKWFVALVIRTGGKETNLKLTTGAHRCGRKLHAYGSGFTDRDGNELQCRSEQDVFEFAGQPYLEPEDRP